MFDPRRPTLRYRLDRGDTLGVAWLSLGSVAVAELAARARPDAIVLDLQHGLWERATMEQAIGAAPSDIPVLVRVAENTPMAIGQALDAGAEGVIVPLVETAKQARKAVEAALYPPRGARSGGRWPHPQSRWPPGDVAGSILPPGRAAPRRRSRRSQARRGR